MAAGQSVTYTITAVAPETRFGPTSTPIPGKLVTFSTSSDYTGTLFIPDSVLGDASAVKMAVEAEVKRIIAIQALTGTVSG